MHGSQRSRRPYVVAAARAEAIFGEGYETGETYSGSDLVGWRYAFAFLALGPFVGVVAMARLRRHPDAVKLAGGRR